MKTAFLLCTSCKEFTEILDNQETACTCPKCGTLRKLIFVGGGFSDAPMPESSEISKTILS